MARVIPDLTVLQVSALPTPASSYAGQFRRTSAGLFWSNGTDWVQIDAGNTSVETIDPWEYLVLPSNAAVSTTAFADVSGMSFTAQANTTYEVELVGAIQSAATTTGAALALDIPSGNVVGQGIHNLAASTLTGWEQIADNTTTGAGSGMRATGTNVPITTRWIAAIGGTGGTVQLRLRSEVASSAVTLQAGLTVMKYRKTERASTVHPIIPVTQAAYDALTSKNPNALYVIVPSVATNPNYKWVALTASEYSALSSKDPETLYVVTD